MELHEVLRRRRMVRRYDPDRPVDPPVLDRVLATALRAPSAGGSAGRDLLVLRTPAQRDRFWADTTRDRPTSAERQGAPDRWLSGMRTAPVLVVCLADPGAYAARYELPDKGGTGDRDAARWDVPWWDVDTGMSALLLLLAAVDEGLGACLFGVPAAAHAGLRASFGVPADRRFVAAVSLGHRADDEASRPSRRPTRTLADVAHDGRFGEPWSALSP